MAKLSTTSVFGDLLVDGMIYGNVTGNLTGNASTATSATTATSAGKWTTARTITIGSKGKTVDGSGNVSWTLAEIGAAASSHNHGLLHDNLTCTLENTTTDNGWSMINSSYSGFLLKSIRTNSSAPSWICNNYSAGIAFGGADTKGVISTAYSSPSIKFAGGNGTKPVWWIGLTGATGTSYNLANFENKNHGTHVTYSTSAPLVAGTASAGSAANVARGDHVHPAQTSVSGNAGTATKLQTPRTINGTNFDGSANITTANWGTSRTLTIGNKGQSVNGSGNITWSTGDILGNATSLSKTSDWNTANTTGIYEASGFNEEGATGANRPVGAYSWGGLLTLRHKNVTNQIYLSHGSNQMWIRGGWNGSFNTSWARVYTTDYKPTYSDVGAAAASHGTHVTWSTTTPKANGTATVGSETKVARGDHVHPLQTTVSGNAGTATKLATAREIKIGNTGKNFDGSANVSWTLSEIGAAASSHNHTTVNKTMITTSLYNAGTGTLVDFNMNEKSGAMVILKLYGNSYSTNPPIEAIYQFYDYSGGAFYNPTGSAISGPAITLKVYRVGGKLKAWFKQPNDYCTFKLEVAYGNNSSTPNVTLSNAAEPTGATETITITPNRVYSAAYKPTPADIGAATSSHGTHVTYATAVPKVAGTAAVGTVNRVAREDHVHPLQTSVSGNAGTATKLATARTIQIGNKSNSFDGSANITYTLADIGAAATSHTHNQINSRGNVTCETGVTGRPAVNGLSMSQAYNNGYPTPYGNVISLKGTGDGQILVGWSGTDGAHAPVYVRSKRDNTSTANWSDWAQFYTTANKPTYSDVGAAAASHGTHVTYATATPKANGTAAIGSVNRVAREDHVHPLQTSVSGNAGTATKLQTARKITIGNASQNFDGSGNVSFTLSSIGAAGKYSMPSSTAAVSYVPLITFADAGSGNIHAEALLAGIGDYGGDAHAIALIRVSGRGNRRIEMIKMVPNSNGTVEIGYTRDATNGTTTVYLKRATYDGIGYLTVLSEIGAAFNTTFTSSTTAPTGYTTGSNQSMYSTLNPQVNITGNAATSTKLATARNIKIGNATKSFNGTANVEFTLAEIGIGSSISAVASNLSGVTINGYDSMMTTINSNLGNL